MYSSPSGILSVIQDKGYKKKGNKEKERDWGSKGSRISVLDWTVFIQEKIERSENVQHINGGGTSFRVLGRRGESKEWVFQFVKLVSAKPGRSFLPFHLEKLGKVQVGIKTDLLRLNRRQSGVRRNGLPAISGGVNGVGRWYSGL